MNTVVEQVFDDASVMAEFALQDKLEKALGDRMMYMAICYALLNRYKGRVEIGQDEMLSNATVYMSMNEAKDGFFVWTEDNVEVEEQDENQLDLPLEEVSE